MNLGALRGGGARKFGSFGGEQDYLGMIGKNRTELKASTKEYLNTMASELGLKLISAREYKRLTTKPRLSSVGPPRRKSRKTQRKKVAVEKQEVPMVRIVIGQDRRKPLKLGPIVTKPDTRGNLIHRRRLERNIFQAVEKKGWKLVAEKKEKSGFTLKGSSKEKTPEKAREKAQEMICRKCGRSFTYRKPGYKKFGSGEKRTYECPQCRGYTTPTRLFRPRYVSGDPFKPGSWAQRRKPKARVKERFNQRILRASPEDLVIAQIRANAAYWQSDMCKRSTAEKYCIEKQRVKDPGKIMDDLISRGILFTPKKRYIAVRPGSGRRKR